MRYLLLVLLTGCGQVVPSNVRVDGEVEVKVVLSDVEKYIHAYCAYQYSDPSEIVDCVNLEMGKLLTKL